MKLLLIWTCILLGLAGQAFAQSPDWAETFENRYSKSFDIVYGVFNNVPVHLDVWENKTAKKPMPTLMYIHGGGWVIGNKEGADPLLFPYLALGWNVVNVEYRMAGSSLAPAAVEDSRCALRWIFRNAAQYNFDTNKIVVTGHSAGGHLALIVGMLPEKSDFDVECPGDEPLRVAAIVNWYGITDVNDLLSGPDQQTYAQAWIGWQQNKADIARAVSPITYVRKGLPPIITVHGDHDPTVPYSQAVRLHHELTRFGVPNQLVTIKDGKHGSFSDAETVNAYENIWKFIHTYAPSLFVSASERARQQ